MSKLLNFTATGTVGGSGFRMGGITLSAAGAAATAVISDGTKVVMQLTTPASQTVPHSMTDWSVGAIFDVSCVLSTLTGAGASVNIEAL
jgi:hypothetical protein